MSSMANVEDNNKKRVAVFGTGGHAKVVLDVMRRVEGLKVAALLDESIELKGTIRLGYKVLGGRDQLPLLIQRGIIHLIIALGDNKNRRSVYEDAVQEGFQLVSVIHPSAQIGDQVRIGQGTLLVAGSVVNVGSIIGANVIVNTGATVDHDCRIGDHVHLSPGVHLAGRVIIENLAHIGTGAILLPSISVGQGSVVGAGAVVCENVPEGCVVAGNPARLVHAKSLSKDLR